DGDIVEHLVAGERRFGITVVVGPGLEFLVNPGGLTYGRISQTVVDRLRARRLQREIAELPVAGRGDGRLLLDATPVQEFRTGDRSCPAAASTRANCARRDRRAGRTSRVAARRGLGGSG